jgi:putative endonuclease
MWYVYILKCNDETLYTGITNDLSKRVSSHNKGTGAKYTKTRLPVELVYYEEALDRSSASKREYQIKKLSKKDKINLVNKN